jgi:hypothetical protein
MKKIFIPLFLFFTLLLSCEAIDELTKFDLDIQTSASIPATTLIDIPFDVQTPDVTTNSQSTFENNNTNRDLIESIKLTRMQLSITSPDDGNFNFIREIRIFIEADGLEEIEIANALDLENTNSNTLLLQSERQELREYLIKDSYQLRIQTITDETINQTHNITIDSKFRVDANILGV